MSNISTFLRSTKLPAMPEVARALIRTLRDDSSDIHTVRDIITQDPALTALLLRAANSALFGLSRKVDTLEGAIRVVGVAHIRARALSICMANAVPLPPGLDRLEFWRNCMASAGYAKWLAASLQMDEQQAWLTAMVLRLGELLIGQNQLSMVLQIEQHPCAPGERWTREREIAGFDEGQIMAAVARHWDFPKAMVQAFDACAQPLSTPPFSPLAGVVHLAALLADHNADSPDVLAALPADVVHQLQLNLVQLQDSMPSLDSLSDASLMPA